MHCSGSLIESPTSSKSIVFRSDHQKSCEGEGGEFSSRMKFPLYEFFRPLREYFLALLSVHEYFSFNFPPREYIFFCTSPPPPTPQKFSNGGPSLNYEYAQYFHLFNLCKWWAPLIHHCKLWNACQAFEGGMKRNFLTTRKFYNYRLQRDSLYCFLLA